jgi:hypothetical protein
MRRALVVGVDDYPGTPLKGCVNDADAVGALLDTHGDGSPNFAVKLMTSRIETVTRSSLRGAVTALFADDCDVALFYFSGHGFVDATGGYLVTPDAKAFDEGLPMDTVLTLANASKAKSRVVILDCCYSGIMGTPAAAGRQTAQLAEGLTVLTASRDSESALEADGSGVFTALVVDALQGGGADLRGHVTPGSLYAYVDQALGAWDQRPIFKTNITQFTSLRVVAPQVPLSTLRKLPDYFPEPQDVFALDPSYEFTQEGVADPSHVSAFKELQAMESVGLIVPVDADHMYFAAMNSTGCRLTALGYQYWRLARERRL